MRPVALMRRGIAPPTTSAMNSRRFIAIRHPIAFNHNEFFATGPSRRAPEMGQKRLDPLPATSGLLRTTDIIRPLRLVRFVPQADIVTQ